MHIPSCNFLSLISVSRESLAHVLKEACVKIFNALQFSIMINQKEPQVSINNRETVLSTIVLFQDPL